MNLEYISCDICKSKSYDLVFKTHDPIGMTHCEFSIVKCKDCGLIYLNPRPSEKQITSCYPKNYYAFTDNPENRIKCIVREHVIRGKNNKADFLDRLFYYCLRSRVKYLSYDPVGKFLDIGCGTGKLVQTMKKMGWWAYGIEINFEAVRKAQSEGINVLQSDVKYSSLPSNFFNLIHMDNVLEHVSSPLQALCEISRILKKHGRFHCSVPNFGSFQSRNFGRFWRALDVPRHLYFFTGDTLATLFEKASLKILALSSSIREGDERSASTKLMLNNIGRGTSYSEIITRNFKELIIKPILFMTSRQDTFIGQQLVVEASGR